MCSMTRLMMPSSSRARTRMTAICSSTFPTASRPSATVKPFREFASVSNHSRPPSSASSRGCAAAVASMFRCRPLIPRSPDCSRLLPRPAASAASSASRPAAAPPGRRRLAARDKMKAREGQTLGKPRMIDGIVVFGDPDEDTMAQIKRCAAPPETYGAVLCADAHKGYSMPIGGVVAYRGLTSPSGVGFDIGCGNKAVRTNLKADDVRADIPRLMDEIFDQISFGIGRKNPQPIDHPVFDDERWTVHPGVAALKKLAREQLGTVGAGNHYVNLMEDVQTGDLWVAVHFGSRGFGHKTATGFLNL